MHFSRPTDTLIRQLSNDVFFAYQNQAECSLALMAMKVRLHNAGIIDKC